ncbi:MAG: hypothetical protein AAFZ52_13905, partial [Bacteroidota bacterium]
DRLEYVAVQEDRAARYGWNFAPLGQIIPSWAVWDSLGYAEDGVHSNNAGGKVIGKYLFDVVRGAYRFHPSKKGGGGGIDGLSANGIVYTNGAGTATAAPNSLYFDAALNRLGILNSAPTYSLDLPNSATNSWRLPGFIMTPSGGLVWDNTSSAGLEGDVIWNINANNNFEVNLTGGSAGFNINAPLVPIKLGEALTLEGTGGLTFDNTALEGDVLWRIDGGNDFRVELPGSGTSNFRVTWNGTALELMELHFDEAEFGVPLKLNSLGAGDGVTSGLLYRQNSNDRVRQMTWADLVTRFDAEGLATDAEVATIQSLLLSGAGSPEGSVTADPGTLYLNTSGGAGQTLWVKESGTGNTGWVAK